MVSGVRRLLHWGPILALTVISTVSICSIICDLQWWPVNTAGGALNMFVFLIWNVLTLYNFFNAAFVGPGYMESGWKPKNEKDTENLQYCNMCEGYKPPRSHHCRKCQRCVMKMDHHCPWINNCVGHKNHAYFTYFLFWAPIGCIHAAFILIPSMYRAINRPEDGPYVQLEVYEFIACIYGTVFSLGVTGAVGFLLFDQVRSILRNETGIESWIKDKAEYRDREEDEPEFVFPYHLGRWENWKMVCHIHARPELDGTWWPVREGCDQYTLTIEQIKQKKEKKDRSVDYSIKTAFSGTMCPITWGPKVCCCPPCTDEPRIPLVVGDSIRVTRWKRHWLYGDKLLNKSDTSGPKRVRGWFPRRCAVEIMDRSEEQGAGDNADSQNDISHPQQDGQSKKKN